jgi:GT2 family glycosyltransferase
VNDSIRQLYVSSSPLTAIIASLRRVIVGRSPREIGRTLVNTWRRLRSEGASAVLGRIQDAPNAERQDEAFRAWVARHTLSAADLGRLHEEAAALPWRPLISVVTPVFNTDPVYLRACIESVRAQVYDHWELCLCDDASTRDKTRAVLREYDDPRIKVRLLATNVHISAASNAALELATGEFVALLDHDDELTPDALFHVVRLLAEHRDADLIYSDEDKLSEAGDRCDPYFKPDWSPEHFLSTMYTCHLMVVRRSLLAEIGGFRTGYEGAQDYDVVLRVMERTARIHHLPRILYHWRKIPGSAASVNDAKPWALDSGRKALEDYVRRTGAGADVCPGCAPGVFRIRYPIAGDPLVSMLIPTRGSGELAVRCLRSIGEQTAWKRFEIVVAADGPISKEMRDVLKDLPAKVIDYRRSGGFNFAHQINAAAREARGDHLLLLNDDVEAVEEEWLSALVEYSQQPGIGAVGAKLTYPDGRLQHVGIVLGVCGIAAHAFHQHPATTAGYSSSALRPGNFSAVSAACLMTRRAVFDEVGGMDEGFAVDFNDVDYCLRVRRAGYRIVFTPYARLVHHESASTGYRAASAAECARMREIWGPEIDRDPYYNPNLTRHFPDYRLRSD